ncbi:uncharacterized protein METZ01_LOCUS358114, partial [marine metagenome]
MIFCQPYNSLFGKNKIAFFALNANILVLKVVAWAQWRGTVPIV